MTSWQVALFLTKDGALMLVIEFASIPMMENLLEPLNAFVEAKHSPFGPPDLVHSESMLL